MRQYGGMRGRHESVHENPWIGLTNLGLFSKLPEVPSNSCSQFGVRIQKVKDSVLGLRMSFYTPITPQLTLYVPVICPCITFINPLGVVSCTPEAYICPFFSLVVLPNRMP